MIILILSGVFCVRRSAGCLKWLSFLSHGVVLLLLIMRLLFCTDVWDMFLSTVASVLLIHTDCRIMFGMCLFEVFFFGIMLKGMIPDDLHVLVNVCLMIIKYFYDARWLRLY